jgi:hypothetical protein
MLIRIFVFLFITFNTFSNFVSGQLKPQAPPTQSHLDAEALREYYKHSKPTPPKSTYTPPKTNTSSTSGRSTGTSNTEFIPSAEAQKAFDDAIIRYDEKIKMASTCVCNALPYAEVKFIYSTPVYQKKYGLYEKSRELSDLAKQLNDVRLLSGYLLNIKGEGRRVVVVESTSGNGKVWKPYLIKWDKYNSGIEWGVEINTDISGPGSYATLTAKLKYIEKAIPVEQERKMAEQKSNAEAAKKKGEYDEIKRQSQLANIKYLEPYKIMYVENLEGYKLDIKNYPLGPDEEFVTFFVSEEKGLFGSITNKGMIYKVIVGKYGSFYTVGFLNYTDIIPTELLVELSKDPIKYKILERMVSLKLGLIGTYESDKLEQAEKKYFRETISRMQNSEKKKADDLRKGAEERSQFEVKTIDSKIYIGNFYEEKMNGIGYRSINGYHYSGVFDKNRPVLGIIHSPEGITRIGFEYIYLPGKPTILSVYTDGKKAVLDKKYNYDGSGKKKDSTEKETLFFKNGEIYDGDNLKNPNAYGIKWFPNGDVYNGRFTDSVFNGDGRYITASSGEVYEGHFDQGVKYGYGTEYDNQGGRIVKYENGKREKKTQNTTNSYYEFRNGNPLFRSEGLVEPYPVKYEFSIGESFHGLLYINPKTFSGTIGLKNGQVVFGNFKLQENSTTIGTLISDEDSAAVRFISYPNEDFYCGKMSAVFLKKGMGAYCYANGEVYIGNFSNDQRNDKEGMIVYPNGNILRAIFVNDKIEGPGEYLDVVKKEKYVGNFKEGIRDGEGTLYFADGTSKKVRYINGVLQQ